MLLYTNQHKGKTTLHFITQIAETFTRKESPKPSLHFYKLWETKDQHIIHFNSLNLLNLFKWNQWLSQSLKEMLYSLLPVSRSSEWCCGATRKAQGCIFLWQNQVANWHLILLLQHGEPRSFLLHSWSKIGFCTGVRIIIGRAIHPFLLFLPH